MSTPTPRAPHLRVGADGEAQAAAYLQAQGLALLERNYRCRAGELDLIMRDDRGVVVFVEVRVRSNPDYGGPLASITPRKQRRLARSAAHWLQARRLTHQALCRFDVVAFSADGQPEWLRNAFSAAP